MIDEDHFVYMKRSEINFVILSFYADDILLAGNSLSFVNAIKSWLSLNFEMKDMSETEFILEVKIQRDHFKNLFTLSQESYIEKIFERFKMKDCKPIDTPIAKGEVLSLAMYLKTQSERASMRKDPYSSAVRSLMYAMMCTQLDICYAVGLVSHYQSNPG